MIDRFAELLHSLGNVFGMEMHPDKRNACAIQVKKGLVVQLEPDDTQEKLRIASRIVEVPPGKFRELVLKEALKANALPDPRVGTFAFVVNTTTLVLFQEYPFDLLTGERVAGLLIPFIDAAESWRTAIQSGLPSPPQPAAIP